MDIQNDEDAFDLAVEPKVNLEVVTEEEVDEKEDQADIIAEIQKKISELEDNNRLLENELTRTQIELSRKDREIKRQKVANVYLETSSRRPSYHDNEVDGLWGFLKKFASSFLQGVLNLFGIRF